MQLDTAGENRRGKKALHTVVSISFFGRISENRLVWKDENKTSTLSVENILLRFGSDENDYF